MNFNIRKQFFLDEDDLSVFDGPRLVFRVSELKKGLFVYNKSGDGIAQVVYQKKNAFVTLRADDKPSVPLHVIQKGKKFFIEYYDFEVQGTNFRKAKRNPASALEIAGVPKKYNYKITENGNTVVGVTYSGGDTYNIDIAADVNNLKFLLAVVAIEKMIFDPDD